MISFSKHTSKKTFFIATGGTGGHVFPALALAQHLKESGHSVHVTTDIRGVNYIKKFPLSFKFSIILNKNLGTGSLKKRFFSILPSCIKTIKLFFSIKPKGVISFGGYPSFPACLAATILRIPLFIHEQNSVAGRVNRVFFPFAKAIMTSFPRTKYINSKYYNKVYTTGNFVRKSFLEKTMPFQFPTQNKDFYIFSLGGSQGAANVASKTISAIDALPQELKKHIHLNLQAPKDKISYLKKIWPTYKEKKETIKIAGIIQPFFKDTDHYLNKSHLIITRSGASAVWEVLATKRPAIFLPLSTAMDNHQYYNALYLAEKNAAWLLTEKEATINNLQLLLQDAMNNKNKLLKLQESCEHLHTNVFKKNPLVFATEILQSNS